MNGRLLVLASCWLCLLSSGPVRADPTATLTAQADPVQAVGLPVIVHLTLKNIGREPFDYTTGGPGHYPGAQLFFAAVKSGTGKLYRTETMDFVVSPYSISNMPPGNVVEIYNGQYWRALAACVNVPIAPGDVVDVPVAPGDVVDVPVALSPLPPGRYTLTFDSERELYPQPFSRDRDWPGAEAAPIIVNVQDDPALAQAEADALRQRARANDPFSRAVCSYFYVPR